MLPFDFQPLIDGISADLAAAQAMSGASQAAAGQFQVDLATLYKHYNDVKQVHDELFQKLQKLANESASQTYPSSKIPGVQKALEKTWDTVSGSDNSLIGGLQGVLSYVSQYAKAIHDVYLSYLKADSDGLSTLTAAGNPDAATVSLSN